MCFQNMLKVAFFKIFPKCLEQRPEADGPPPQEGRGAQAGLRLQEEARGAGYRDGGVGEEVC